MNNENTDRKIKWLGWALEKFWTSLGMAWKLIAGQDFMSL